MSKVKGVRVYWANSMSGTVGSDIAIKFTATKVEFADGGRNPLSSTYLTEAQARRAERLPPVQPKIEKATKRALKKLEDAVEILSSATEAKQ